MVEFAVPYTTPTTRSSAGGIYTGAGAPTNLAAVKGSLYVNTTATTSATRLYINTDGKTTWAAFTATS